MSEPIEAIRRLRKLFPDISIAECRAVLTESSESVEVAITTLEAREAAIRAERDALIEAERSAATAVGSLPQFDAPGAALGHGSCPACGGGSRRPVSLNYWHCTSTRTWSEETMTPFGVSLERVSRECGHRYHEVTSATTGPLEVCKCGTYAVGRCVGCSAYFCGDCSSTVASRRLCQDCADEARLETETRRRLDREARDRAQSSSLLNAVSSTPTDEVARRLCEEEGTLDANQRSQAFSHLASVLESTHTLYVVRLKGRKLIGGSEVGWLAQRLSVERTARVRVFLRNPRRSVTDSRSGTSWVTTGDPSAFEPDGTEWIARKSIPEDGEVFGLVSGDRLPRLRLSKQDLPPWVLPPGPKCELRD